LLSHPVGIAKGDAQHALVTRFQRDDVLTRGEHHFANGNHALFANGLADNRKRLLADLAIGRDKVWIADVEFILRLGHKFIDIDRAFALNRNGFELLGCEFDVLVLCGYSALLRN
jgi:hypothetical protein